jgi:hypothetical protein
MNDELQAPAALTKGKPSVKPERRLCGPQSRSGRCGEKNLAHGSPDVTSMEISSM